MLCRTVNKDRHRFFRAVVLRELRRLVSNPLYLLGTIVLPVLSFLSFWAIFVQAVPQELPVAICDHDHSSLSRKLIRMIDATSAIRIMYYVDDLDTAQKYIREGKVYAVVAFQRGLENDVCAGKAPVVVSYYNNQFLLPGSLISRDIRSAIGAASAHISVHSIQPAGTQTISGPFDRDPIKVDVHQLFNPFLNYTYFLVSALLPTMLQIFIFIMTIYVIGIELKESTAHEWYTAAGGHMWKALMGKLSPYTVIFFCLSFFMNYFLFRLLDVPFRGGFIWITLAGLLFVLACQAAGILIITLTANLRFALSVAAFFASTALVFGVVTFPAEGMPAFARVWAQILPLTHYLKIFTNQAVRGGSAVYDIMPIVVLCFFAVLLPVYLLVRLRTLMTTDKYWGRS